jgi:nicotinate-nucleotide adenylyltransferase
VIVTGWVRAPHSLIPGMRIGLLGGSFNPAHPGHIYASELALRKLKLDFIWWLVSPQNPLKPTRGMARFDTRFRAAKQFARDPRIVVSDLEAQFGTQFTSDTLLLLRRRFPRIQFVWIMGSDNLLQLPRWRRWQSIFTTMPVVVIARPGTANAARSCPAARRFAFAWHPPSARFASSTPPAWTILDGRRDPTSATALRASETHERGHP